MFDFMVDIAAEAAKEHLEDITDIKDQSQG
jgi:hypothetical protein